MRRLEPSARVTAPIFTFAQSSLVVGLVSTRPFAVTSDPTASKMLFAIGSTCMSLSRRI